MNKEQWCVPSQLEGTALSQPWSITGVVTGTGGISCSCVSILNLPRKRKSLWQCQHSLGAVWDVTDTSELPLGLTESASPGPGV